MRKERERKMETEERGREVKRQRQVERQMERQTDRDRGEIRPARSKGPWENLKAGLGRQAGRPAAGGKP